VYMHYQTAQNSRARRVAVAPKVEAVDPPAQDSEPGRSQPHSSPILVPEQVEFSGFGHLVRFLRTTHLERVGKTIPGGPEVSVSQMQLIRCMAKHGYTLTSGTFSLIEQGKTLPHDPPGFMDALSKCLGLGPNDFYWYLLRHQYAFDLLTRAAGSAWAAQLVPVGERLADLLRSGHVPPLQPQTGTI
jgi:hypothetical protein